MARRGWIVAGAAVAGVAAGWLLAQRRFDRHRQALFSRHPLRRLGALGYLAGHPGVESIRLLRDYLAWERQPMLRERARTIARRMEFTLDTGGDS